MKLHYLVVVVQFIQVLAAGPYEGHKIFSVDIKTAAQAKELYDLCASDNLDLLNRPVSGRAASVHVAPANIARLESFIGKHDLKYQVTDVEQTRGVKSEGRSGGGKRAVGDMSWDAYYDFEEITAWLKNVASKYQKTVKVDVIGKTHEGREISVVTIKHATGSPKSTTLVDCQIHAREWISGATCTFIINELTENAAKYDDLLKDVKFYIIPVVNPDGFQFSHKQERLWRKNRRTADDPDCFGVDLNRNFPVGWGTVGSSSKPCSFSYHGPSACSEPECQAVKTFLDAHKNEIDVYFTMHCFGQLLLTPWSYKAETPPDQEDIARLTSAVCTGLQSSGLTYFCGPSKDLYDPLAGVSDDYAKDIGIKYTFTLELPPDQRGGSSDNPFHLPEDQILPTVKDAWKGIRIAAWKRNLDGTPLSRLNSSGNGVREGKFLWTICIAWVHYAALR